MKVDGGTVMKLSDLEWSLRRGAFDDEQVINAIKAQASLVGDGGPQLIEVWPLTQNEVSRLTVGFQRAALVAEFWEQRQESLPDLFDPQAWPDPDRQFEALQRLKESIPRNEANEELLRCLVLYLAHRFSSRFEMYETGSEVLEQIHKNLARLSALFEGYMGDDAARKKRLTQSLLRFTTGRILRALGRYDEAETALTAALDLCEQRLADRIAIPLADEDARDYQAACYRAALCTLQLSYLNYLRGRLTAARHHILTSHLLLAQIKNDLALADVKMVYGAIERALNASPYARQQAEGRLRSAFEIQKQHGRQRLMLLSVAQLCRLKIDHDQPSLDDYKDAERYAEEMLRFAQRQDAGRQSIFEACPLPPKAIIYWQAAAHLLMAEIQLKRPAPDPASALKHCQAALVLSEQTRDLRLIHAQGLVCYAEVLIAQGELGEAAKKLQEAEKLNQLPSTGMGEVSSPELAAMALLLRADIAMRRRQYPEAVRLLEDFNQAKGRQGIETWRIHRRAQEIRDALMSDETVFILTDEEAGKLSCKRQCERLKWFLYDSAERRLRQEGKNITLESRAKAMGFSKTKVTAMTRAVTSGKRPDRERKQTKRE